MTPRASIHLVGLLLATSALGCGSSRRHFPPATTTPAPPTSSSQAAPTSPSGTASKSGAGILDLGHLLPFPGGTQVVITQGGGLHGGSAKETYAYDFVSQGDETVVAMRAGTIARNEFGASLGNFVVVDEGQGYFMLYAHLREPSPLAIGDAVGQGSPLGTQGNTGNVVSLNGGSGAHLHVQLMTSSSFSNSLAFRLRDAGFPQGGTETSQNTPLLTLGVSSLLAQSDLKSLAAGPTHVYAGTSGGDVLEVDLAQGTTRRLVANAGDVRGLAYDASRGLLYFSDRIAAKVQAYEFATGLVSTLAGTGSRGDSGDGGPATLARLSSPRELELIGDRLVIADLGAMRLRAIDLATGVIHPVAGTGTQGTSPDGRASSASIGLVVGLAEAQGDLLFVEVSLAGTHSLRRVDLSRDALSTLPGAAQAEDVLVIGGDTYFTSPHALQRNGSVLLGGTSPGTSNGGAGAASFDLPTELVMIGPKSLVVVDRSGLRRVSLP